MPVAERITGFCMVAALVANRAWCQNLQQVAKAGSFNLIGSFQLEPKSLLSDHTFIRH